MSLISRLNRTRFTERLLSLDSGSTKIQENLIKSLKGSTINDISHWWTRHLLTSTIIIDNKTCPCRLDVKREGDEIHYRIRVSQKVDAPLFWGSEKSRIKLKLFANELFDSYNELNTPKRITCDKVGQHLTEYSVKSKFKLP